jgi:hypothetical protein
LESTPTILGGFKKNLRIANSNPLNFIFKNHLFQFFEKNSKAKNYNLDYFKNLKEPMVSCKN